MFLRTNSIAAAPSTTASLLLAVVTALAGCGAPMTAKMTAVTTAGADYQELTSRARALMDERELESAQGLLRDAVDRFPDRPEAKYFIGQIQHRRQEYARAVATYDEILAAHPQYYPAVHRRWIAMLARDQGASPTRERVEAGIGEVLAEHGDDPAALYAVYQGYVYLWKRPERVAVIKRLVPMTEGDDGLRDEVAGALLEEILGAPPEDRVELGELFLKYFPDRRGVRTASRVWVRARFGKEPSTAAKAQELADAHRANRHVQQAVAERLLDDGVALDLAATLLSRHRSALMAAGEPERSQYFSESAWRQLMDWEQGESAYLHGVLRLQQGRLREAAQWLERALARHPKPGQVHAKLADVFEKQHRPEQAIRHLESAFILGNGTPALASNLARLLDELRDYRGEPRRYFARVSGSVTFTEITAEAGLEGVGSQRVAWGDFDNDGYDDLALDGPAIYRNQGGTRFTRLADSAVDAVSPQSSGGLWVDYDNDGFRDLFVSTHDTNALLRNETGIRFRDVTESVFGSGAFLGRTEAAAWGDSDNDGWLDLYIANYERAGLERGLCNADQLFRNDHGTSLREVTNMAGVVTQEPLCGRGVVWTDINGDGWQDVLVTNYRLDPNLLWMNQGGGRFTEQARMLGVRGNNVRGMYGHSIGAAVGDMNNDGRDDVYICNLAHPRYLDVSDTSQLLVSTGAPVALLSDVIAGSGITFDETNAEPSLADVDNDGDLDLYVTSIYPGRSSRLYRNEGDGKFTDVTWTSGTSVDNAWGAAFSDFDNDGDQDLLVASVHGVRLFRNDGGPHGWLELRLESPGCNRFGIGAAINLTADGTPQRREIRAGRGSGSQDSATAHFGLGSMPGPYHVEIRESCGRSHYIEITQPNRIVIVR